MKGYRLPAEWETHKVTWLAWPHNEETWHHGSLKSAQEEYVLFIQEILKGESVNLLVSSSELTHPSLVKLSEKNRDLKLIPFETNDAWIRDYGPDFMVSSNNELLVNWQFNSW